MRFGVGRTQATDLGRALRVRGIFRVLRDLEDSIAGGGVIPLLPEPGLFRGQCKRSQDFVSFVLDGLLLRTELTGGDRLLSDRFEQDFDSRPEVLPLLAFLLRQSGQLLLVADAGEVRAFLPVRQSIANLLLDGGLDDLRSLFPGGQLRLQPVEGLTTQPCLRRVVKQRLVLALPGGRQGRGARGVEAVMVPAVGVEDRVAGERKGPVPGRGGEALAVVGHPGEREPLGAVRGLILAVEDCRKPIRGVNAGDRSSRLGRSNCVHAVIAKKMLKYSRTNRGLFVLFVTGSLKGARLPSSVASCEPSPYVHREPVQVLDIQCFRKVLVQACIITPKADFQIGNLLSLLLREWPERFIKVQFASDFGPGVPPEVPRVILQSADSRYRIHASSARIDVFWESQAADDRVEVAEHLEWCCDVFSQYLRVVDGVVRRMGCVVRSVASDPAPFVKLSRHFCQERWLQNDGPIGRGDFVLETVSGIG